MIVPLKSGIIGVHFLCFRAIDGVPCPIQKSFKFSAASCEIFEGKLAAKSARRKGGLIAELIPEAAPWLDFLPELRQGREIAPHEAHDLSQAPDTLLGLAHGLCSPRGLLGPAVEWGEIEAESHALLAVLADITLPVGAIAPPKQASLNQTSEVTTHGR